MKVSLLVSMLMLASSQAFAGSANANLNCKAADGTTIAGSVPGDYTDFNVTVTENGNSESLDEMTDPKTGNTTATGNITVVQDLANGVYTMAIDATTDDYGFIQFYALPKTVNYKKTSNGYTATFSGQLSFRLSLVSTDREDKTVQCSMSYGI